MYSYEKISLEINCASSDDVISTSDVTFDMGAGIWGNGNKGKTPFFPVNVNILDDVLESEAYEDIKVKY